MVELSLSTLLQYYKRKDIQTEMLKLAQGREVALRYGEGFGKRPDTLNYESDIIEAVKNGATSFHVSEEVWSNPLQLDAKLNRKQLDELRIGWDLVIDIDCALLDYSKIAAHLIIQALKKHGITSVSCKFSGNHGFHIGVPFAAFPEEVQGVGRTKDLFPEGPRKIAAYLKFLLQDPLSKEILATEPIETVMKRTGMTFKQLVKDGKFDAFEILEVDTVLIASRHLYRMPYSFNEKSGLISVPINPDKVLSFNKIVARPENVKISRFGFLDPSITVPGEARLLFVEAFDFEEKTEKLAPKKEAKTFEEITEAIPEELFPPAIKRILHGIDDGKKRAVFILVNFLNSVGWSYDQIEERLKQWNTVNKEPLREVYYVGQLRYHKQQGKRTLPPNYDNKAYYEAMGIRIEPTEARYKNPVNYARRMAQQLQENKPKERKKKVKQDSQ